MTATPRTPVQRPRRIRGLDAEQRRAQRREALLDAALELFARQGFAGTTIEQLCQQAYVGTKAFYETFQSREDCYSGLLQRITDSTFTRLAETVTDEDDETAGSRRLIEEFAHAFVDDIRIATVAFGEGSAITPAAERQRRGNRRAAVAFLESHWARFGEATTPRHHDIAIGLIGGLFDIVADWTLDATDAPSANDTDISVLIDRLQNFYAATRAGM